MEGEGKKRIGTIEGVALILSMLACLILFLKIMPNINSNMEFYNEKLRDIDNQMIQLTLKMDNLQKTGGKGESEMQIRKLQDSLFNLEMIGSKVPENQKERLAKVTEELTKILQEIQR